MKIVQLLTCFLLAALCACTAPPAATEAPATPLPQPTVTPSTPPTPTEDPALICLQGDWVLDATTAEILLSYLSSIPSMKVLEGGLYMRFDDSNFAYHSDDLFLRTSFLNGFLDARAKVLIEGTYTTDGDKILFTKVSAKNELYDWRAVDSAGNVQPFSSTSPVHDFVIAEAGTFECSGDTLRLTFDAAGLESLVFDLARIK